MANAARRIDRLDTAPRFTAADAEALNARFADVPTKDMLAAVLAEGLAGRIAAVSSFGAESAVLLHLIASVDRTVPVLFLDTGKHFPETLAYRDEIVRRLGLTNLINLTPDPALLAQKDETGLRWSYDPDGCCELRKVLPLASGSFDLVVSELDDPAVPENAPFFTQAAHEAIEEAARLGLSCCLMPRHNLDRRQPDFPSLRVSGLRTLEELTERLKIPQVVGSHD